MVRRVLQWVSAGVLALAVLGPAGAQSAPSDRPAEAGGVRPPATEQEERLMNGGIQTVQAGSAAVAGTGNGAAAPPPPGMYVTYPHAPTQHPLILRNMLQMRATSPRPDQFLGGAYNPVYRPLPTSPSYGGRPVYYWRYPNGYWVPVYEYAVPGGYVTHPGTVAGTAGPVFTYYRPVVPPVIIYVQP